MPVRAVHFAWFPWLAAAVGTAFLLAGCAGRAFDREGAGEGNELLPPPPECPAGEDAGGDTSLDGTLFANVIVRWPSALLLCNTWGENIAADDERSKKVRVVIPPQPRPSLGAQHIAQAGLVGVALERGVLANERVATSVCPGDAVVAGWTIDESTPTSPVLRASNRYPLGSAGAILETIVVDGAAAVQAGQAAAEVVYGESQHVSFGFESADAAVSMSLQPCIDTFDTVGASTEGIEIIVGEAGGESIALLRHYQTDEQPGGGVAGSHSVRWRGTLVTRTDARFVLTRARDFWPHTYAALSGNRQETSRIDFDRDLGNYHLFFAAQPMQSAGRALKTLRFVNIDPFESKQGLSTVDVDLASGVETPTDWVVSGRAKRVDATALEASFARDCPDGVVKANGSLGTDELAEFTVQMLICPRAARPGYEVCGVVPVLFGANTSVLGQLFASPVESVVDGAASWHFALGSATIDVRHSAVDEMIMDVVSSDGSSYHALFTPMRLDVISVPTDDTLRFASADGTVALTLVRRRVGTGIGKSSLFAPVTTELLLATSEGTRRLFVDGFDAQTYSNTHHNWSDTLVARAPEARVQWSAAVDFEVAELPLVYTVSVTDAGGAVVLAPTRLLLSDDDL